MRERGGGWLAAEQQKKREKIMMIIRLHFFYTDQQLAAIQALMLESPGNAVVSIATGKKQNTTSPLHCKQTPSVFWGFLGLSGRYH